MLAVSDRLVEAAVFVLIGICFDFLDGLVARLLNAQSALGKELDSLADLVTSGLVPGIVMFQLFMRSLHRDWTESLSCEIGNWVLFEETGALNLGGAKFHLLPFLGLLLTLAAAYRLANFNLDKRQSNSFIGLPTPAMALFVLSLPVILAFDAPMYLQVLILNKPFLIIVTLGLSLLMNLELKLFSLKFKNFKLSTHWIPVLFLVLALIALLLLHFVAIPLIILLYIGLSFLKNMRYK